MLKKFIFRPGKYPFSIDFALLFLRVCVGLLMLTHGLEKFSNLISNDPVSFPDPIGFGASVSLGLTVFAEMLCSIFLLVGFATRLSSIPLLITMLVAAFIIHADDAFSKMELPLLYACIYVVLIFTGAGSVSIDRFIYKKK